jgi:hypothetical protein
LFAVIEGIPDEETFRSGSSMQDLLLLKILALDAMHG